MLIAIALTLTLTAAAADCVPKGELIVIQDDLMMISVDHADDLEIQVEGMITDDRVPWISSEGEVVALDAETLEEGTLREGYSVYEDHIMLRTGSTGLTIDEYAFLIAGMGTEVLVFLTSDYVFEDHVILAPTLISGPLEAIAEELPEGAVQLIPAPTCR